MFAPGIATQGTFDRAIANAVIRPFILVAPDYTTRGPGMMFANSCTEGRFEDHTLQEVVPFIDSNYRTLPKLEGHAIMGDFMGAYGALRYAFRHPDVFSVVYGMHPVGTGSGVLPLFQWPDWVLLNKTKSPEELRGDQLARCSS
jgi:enterochelin esterase-like enzyme